jgi:transketolase C-terminal domain/subunit
VAVGYIMLEESIEAEVIDMHTIKPFDSKTLLEFGEVGTLSYLMQRNKITAKTIVQRARRILGEHK